LATEQPTQPRIAIRRAVETPAKKKPKGLKARIKRVIEWMTPRTAEEKWAAAFGVIVTIVVAGIMLLILTSGGAHYTPEAARAAEPIQRPTEVPLRELNNDLEVSQIAETATITNVIASVAPEPTVEVALPVLPSWATPECVSRIAGTVQGETGGLSEDAWYAVAQQISWDSNQCNLKVTWGGGTSGTSNEVHAYTFEKTWYGRTSKNDNRLLDKGMVESVLAEEVRPAILKAVTQALVDFGSDKANYPDCEYTDNLTGMFKRVAAGAKIDYIFTGAGNRVTDTGAVFLMNCPSGK